MLTETAASEWPRSGVRVNCIAPGGIASSGFDTYTPEMRKRLLDCASRVPARRFGTEAEVSAAIVFLLSPAAAHITGWCIRVDGGAPNVRQTAHCRSMPPASRSKASTGRKRPRR